MKAPEKIKLLFWTASHDSLPTKSLLHRRGMVLSPICYRCNDHVEDVLHYLRDCLLLVFGDPWGTMVLRFSRS